MKPLVKASIRRNATSGLVVLVPVLVTLYALYWLYGHLASVPLIGSLAPQVPVLGRYAPALSAALFTLAVLVAVVFGVGYLMRTALGVVVAERIDDYVNRVPGFRMVYNASQMAVETAVSDNVELKQPAKVEIWGDTRLTAFRTGNEAPDGKEVLFVPTSPNVTSGIVVEVHEEDVIDPDETLEDSLTRVLSAGFGERTETAEEVSTPEELEEFGRDRRADDESEGDRRDRAGEDGAEPAER